MTFPSVTISFGRLEGWVLGESLLGTNTTLATYTYEDITAPVLDFAIHRGRQHELDRIEAGVATLTLMNQDGAFTPTNTASPYYPDIRPMVPIKITAEFEDNPFPSISGLVGRYDFSNAATMFTDTAATIPVASDGDEIQAITDLSVSNKTLTVAGVDGAAYKLNILNGKSVGRFSAGRQDYLTAATALTITQPTTLFLVTTNIGATASQMNIVTNSAGNQNTLYLDAGTSFASMYAGAVLNSATAVDDGVARIWGGIFDGGSSKLYLNGGATAASGSAGTEGIGTLRIGADSTGSVRYTGDIGEVLIYDALLGAADINLVGNYLSIKWGITWTNV